MTWSFSEISSDRSTDNGGSHWICGPWQACKNLTASSPPPESQTYVENSIWLGLAWLGLVWFFRILCMYAVTRHLLGTEAEAGLTAYYSVIYRTVRYPTILTTSYLSFIDLYIYIDIHNAFTQLDTLAGMHGGRLNFGQAFLQLNKTYRVNKSSKPAIRHAQKC